MLAASFLALAVAVILVGSASSQTSSTFKCPQVGFFVDPEDCRNFYRCYIPPPRNCGARCTEYERGFREDDFPYQQAKFTCGEGTIFDQRISTCNYPANVDPGQQCATVNDDQPSSTASSLYPETVYHECFGVDNYRQVHCIKNMGGDEFIIAANTGKRDPISFAVVEVAYRCGNPRDVIGRNPLGNYRVEQGNATSFRSAMVENGFCRKHIFYNCEVNGSDSNCVNPPFYIQFTFEFAPVSL